MEPGTHSWLLAVARRALRAALADGDPSASGLVVPNAQRPAAESENQALRTPQRLFVSWYDDSQLVGCIGALEPRLALEEAVEYLSVQSGIHDPRMPSATVEQYERLRCEISVLSEPQPLGARGLRAIAAAVVPGRDGVLLDVSGRSAFFLPQVWNKIPDRRAFLEALCRKAQVDLAEADADARASVFTAEVFRES
jgi:AmmeMemoRadiSam system protein A